MGMNPTQRALLFGQDLKMFEDEIVPRTKITENEKNDDVLFGEGSTKNATVTVNLTNGYYNQDVNPNTEYYMPKNDTFTMADVIKGYDVKESSRSLSDVEKNSAACAVIDNNRWMVTQINETYLYAQVMQDLLEKGMDEDEATSMASELITNTASYLSDTDYGYYAKKIQGVGGEKYEQYPLDVRADQIAPELIEATEFELVDDAKKVGGVFRPNLNTMVSNKKSGKEELSESVVFGSENGEIFSFGNNEKQLYEQAEVNGTTNQFVQNWLADKCGLGELQDDGTFRYYGADGKLLEGEGCDTTADLLSSYAGIAVLSSIAKEKGNSEIFDGLQENPEDILGKIYELISYGFNNTEDKNFKLYCPPVELNAMYTDKGTFDANNDGAISQDELRATFVQERDKVGTITYIHTNQDSLVPKPEGKDGQAKLTGMDVLAEYNMPPYGNMADWAQSRIDQNKLTKDDVTLLLSMYEQIEANNPGMGVAVIDQSTAVFDELLANGNEDLIALIPEETDLKNLSDDEKKDYLAQFFNDDDELRESVLNSLSPETKLSMYMNADYVGFVLSDEQGGELSLTNIEYILQKEVKPASKPKDPPADTPIEPEPTDPAPTEPAPTEPAPTDPAPTEPAPTDPAPTDPAPTDPAPTDPAPTDPAPTDPETTPCPDPPEVNPSDTPIEGGPPEMDDPTPSEPCDPNPPVDGGNDNINPDKPGLDPAPPEPTEAPPEPTEAPPESTEAPPESTEAPPESTEAPPESTTCPPVGTEDGTEEEKKEPENEDGGV